MSDNPLSGPMHRLFDKCERLERELAEARAECERLRAALVECRELLQVHQIEKRIDWDEASDLLDKVDAILGEPQS